MLIISMNKSFIHFIRCSFVYLNFKKCVEINLNNKFKWNKYIYTCVFLLS